MRSFTECQNDIFRKVTSNTQIHHLKMCLKFLKTVREVQDELPDRQDSIVIVKKRPYTKQDIKSEIRETKEENGDIEDGVMTMEPMDSLISFTSQNSPFTKESEIIKISQKLSKKLRAIFSKENKNHLIDKIMIALSL